MNMPVHHPASPHRIREIQTKLRSVVCLDVLHTKGEVSRCFLEEHNTPVAVGFFGQCGKTISRVYIQSSVDIYSLPVFVHEVDGVHLNECSSHRCFRSLWVYSQLLPRTSLFQKPIS